MRVALQASGWVPDGGRSGHAVARPVKSALEKLDARFPDPWNIAAASKKSGLEQVIGSLVEWRVLTRGQGSAMLAYLRGQGVDETRVVGYNSKSILEPLASLGYSALSGGPRMAREILMRWAREHTVPGASQDWSDY
jgi:hypothetical protein